MSKLICDVCGTAYPETNTVCPICGSANASNEHTSAGNVPEEEQGAAYAYVKGGRFSKRNVRRRNTRGSEGEIRVPAAERRSRDAEEAEDEAPMNNEGGEETVNKGLVAVVIVLLLAIVAVLFYIGFKFLAPDPDISVDPNPTPTTNVEPTPTAKPDPTEPPTEADVPCTGLTLSMENLSFTTIGGEYSLMVTLDPTNTTDTVTFVSADPSVATVSADGDVRAVGFGETTITITCGEITKTCKVVCISGFTFEFNTNPKWNDPVTGYADTTVTQGENWKAYKGALSVPADQITWISDDLTIATIQNGIVTAVSPGKTLIHAEYGGKRYTCIFRVKASQATGGDEFTSTPNDSAFSFRWAKTPNSDGKFDVTMSVGSTWKAYEDGIDPTSVAWSIVNLDPNDTTVYATVSTDGVVSFVATNGLKASVELHAVYDGVTFICILRIKPATT